MPNLNDLKLMIDQSRESFPDVFSDEFTINAAVQVIIFFLGLDWYNKVVADQKRPKDVNQWFLNDGHLEHYAIRCSRIVLLASILFRMRDVVGFDVLLERFHSRVSDPKSCFLEAYAASEFVNANTTVHIHKENKVKGQDFDFKIVSGNQVVNAEVTSRGLEEISERSILNTLRKKHRQLPADSPSIILIYISQAQYVAQENQRHIETVISEFFRRNFRVNRVVIFSDMIISSSGQPFFSVVGSVDFSNPDPRFEVPASILDRASAGKINTEKVKELNGSASVDSILGHLLKASATKIRIKSSFLTWYHHASAAITPTNVPQPLNGVR